FPEQTPRGVTKSPSYMFSNGGMAQIGLFLPPRLPAAPGCVAQAHKRAAPLLREASHDVLRLKRRRGTAVVRKKRHLPALSRPTEPITCNCGGQAYLMRRTLHPKIKGEIWTFECKDCSKQTEKCVLH